MTSSVSSADTSARTADSISWYVLIPLVLTAVVYFPITGNYFWADDFINLYRIRNEALGTYLLQPQGHHLLVTTYVIFYLFDSLFGVHPAPYFWSVLLTHLVGVALLFAVIRRCTNSESIACFGAALWGTSPVLEGTLGWYSVYGQVSATALIFWLLYDVTDQRRERTVSTARIVIWIAVLLLAATSFGIAIGAVLVFPAVVWILLPPSPVRRSALIASVVAAVVVPLLYLGLHGLYGPMIEDNIAAAIPTGLPRIWQLLLTMTFDLAGYGINRAVLGTLRPGPDYPDIIPSIAIGVYVLLAAAALLRGPGRLRRSIVAALLLALAGYAMIAAGRAAFYAGNPQIRAAARYHYFATAVLVWGWAAALASIGSVGQLAARAKSALLAAGIGAIIIGYWAYGVPMDRHERTQAEVAQVISAIRSSIDAVPAGGKAFIPIQRFKGVGPMFANIPTIFPGYAGVFVVFFDDNTVDGKRVHFVARPMVAASAAHGKRTAGLILDPAAAHAESQRP